MNQHQVRPPMDHCLYPIITAAQLRLPASELGEGLPPGQSLALDTMTTITTHDEVRGRRIMAGVRVLWLTVRIIKWRMKVGDCA